MNKAASRAVWVICVLTLISLLAFVIALQVGSSSVSVWSLAKLWWQGELKGDNLELQIFLNLRLPRVLTAFCVGGLLGVAGLLMQVLLKNPLADPYILGVSGGAGLGGIALALLLPGVFAWALPAGAALGALVVIILVFGLSGFRGVVTMERLLLTGVAMSALCSAFVSLLLTFAAEGRFRGLVFWLLGELEGGHAGLLMLAWVLMLLLTLPMARMLNVVSMGDDVAFSLGVSVRSARHRLYWMSALFTGIAVAAGGMIGFVGLVVPHVLRLLLGQDHRLLVPAVALGGGVFLMLADCVSRVALAPVQLPVGVVTAMVGAPLFIVLLARRGRV